MLTRFLQDKYLPLTYPYQGWRGHWTVYYTCPPKSYNNVFLFVSLKTLGIFIKI